MDRAGRMATVRDGAADGSPARRNPAGCEPAATGRRAAPDDRRQRARIADRPALLNGAASLWGLFTSAFISSTLAPGGSEALLAYLLNQSAHPPGLLVAIATLGNTLGALTTWLLGWWTARRYPADHPDEPARHKAVRAVRRWGQPVLLLSWLPVVGDGFCFAAGWLRLAFWPSLLAIALGKLGRYAVIAWAVP